MKKCSKCKTDKDESEFSEHSKKTDGLQPYCIECQNAYNSTYHIDNKQRIKNYKKNKRKEKTDIINTYKTKCIICGENHPAVLDFHHNNPKDKEDDISVLSRRGFSLQKILDEISKCNVYCSNCHRKLHWEEKHSGIV